MNSFQQAVALAAVIALYALMRSAVRGTRAPGGPAPVPAPATEGAFGHLATQDWMVTSYLLVLTLLVGFGSGDRQPQAMRWILLDDLGFVFLLALARAPQTPRRLADMAYRIALPGAIIATFTQLHYILPSASATSWDAQIYAADKALFHFEPAEAWDRYVNPRTTEWFSFFYYLYFGILLVHIVPMSLFERRMHVLREFSWGIFTVFCVGQLVYTLVPGFGPASSLRGSNTRSRATCSGRSSRRRWRRSTGRIAPTSSLACTRQSRRSSPSSRIGTATSSPSATRGRSWPS